MSGEPIIVVVRNCNFKQWSEFALKQLDNLEQIPNSNFLIFTAESFDKRLKPCKILAQYCQVEKFDLIPPWRTDLIASSIRQVAQSINLKLTDSVVNYLTVAIGNDTARQKSELQKLATYTNNNQLLLQQVKVGVTVNTCNYYELANAIRTGQTRLTFELASHLLSLGEYPLSITAILISQFRTWIAVKAAREQKITKISDIASIARLNNPQRIYYLKQEVERVALMKLVNAQTLLFDLEICLKQGERPQLIPIKLLAVARLFS